MTSSPNCFMRRVDSRRSATSGSSRHASTMTRRTQPWRPVAACRTNWYWRARPVSPSTSPTSHWRDPTARCAWIPSFTVRSSPMRVPKLNTRICLYTAPWSVTRFWHPKPSTCASSWYWVHQRDGDLDPGGHWQHVNTFTYNLCFISCTFPTLLPGICTILYFHFCLCRIKSDFHRWPVTSQKYNKIYMKSILAIQVWNVRSKANVIIMHPWFSVKVVAIVSLRLIL